MNSLAVLQKEKEICDKIIKYKKSRGANYEVWETKIEDIDFRISTVKDFIESGTWDFDRYKKEIMNQYKSESKLLLFVEKDPKLNAEQKKALKERIEERIKVIDNEIKETMKAGEEEEEEEPKEEAEKKETKKEEPKKEKPKKEVKKVKIDTKKSLNPKLEVPNDEENEEKERINEIVIDRLNEYRAAIDYFQTNELADQRLDANSKAKKICVELKKIQDGKWKEVNEFKLPAPITPEYIYGYSKEERTEKFNKIIKDYEKQRKEIQDLMNQILETIQKQPAQKRRKLAEIAKKDLDQKKSKKGQFDKLINILKEKLQDKWVPAPLFVEQDKEIQIEKINKDIPENTLRFIFGKTSYKKNKKVYLIVSHPEKNFEIKIQQKALGDWTNEFDWKYEKSYFKQLYRAKIHVEIFYKKVFKDKHKGHFDIELKDLANHIEFTDEYPLILESGRKGEMATVTVKVRTP